MITASSIGYGDVTPKNDLQIYFLLVFIPLMIISFGIYCSRAVACFDELMSIIN
jgi:hypothetical protein